MKAAVIDWNSNDLMQMISTDAVMDAIEASLQKSAAEEADILVFPALTGCLYQYFSLSCQSLNDLKARTDCNNYLEKAVFLSDKYGVALCPGSYWESKGGEVYHASCLITDGKIVLEQRQLYLAKWERHAGLSRDVTAGLYDLNGWKIGIVLSTDVFYPQVSRLLALKGADIVLSPVAFTGIKNKAIQLSGMWQETQQNLFFALESGFNGNIGTWSFWGDSFIHAPLEMTAAEDGLLSQNNTDSKIIIADLDNEMRKKAVHKFNVLSMLNPSFCRKMPGFGDTAVNGIAGETSSIGEDGTLVEVGVIGNTGAIGEVGNTWEACTIQEVKSNA